MSDTDLNKNEPLEVAKTVAPKPAPAKASKPKRQPPEGVMILGETGTGEASVNDISSGTVSAVFDDAYVGKGGTYAFNEAGERVPVYERFIDDDGEVDYRPVG